MSQFVIDKVLLRSPQLDILKVCCSENLSIYSSIRNFTFTILENLWIVSVSVCFTQYEDLMNFVDLSPNSLAHHFSSFSQVISAQKPLAKLNWACLKVKFYPEEHTIQFAVTTSMVSKLENTNSIERIKKDEWPNENTHKLVSKHVSNLSNMWKWNSSGFIFMSWILIFPFIALGKSRLRRKMTFTGILLKQRTMNIMATIFTTSFPLKYLIHSPFYLL